KLSVSFPVQCKAVVCPTQFKTQRFCDMLRQICTEMDTAESGVFRSSRYVSIVLLDHEDSRGPNEGCYCHVPGTTGSPKGATLSHHNIVNNSYFVGLRLGYNWRTIRVCVPVPLYHCFGSVIGGMCMALHGITLVFPSAGYDSRANLEAIQNERCNFLYGTPTMYIDMLGQPDLHKYDLSSVETGYTGGSPCPPEVMKKLKTHMNVKNMITSYGTTENSPITFLGFPRDNEELMTQTVGCILNHTEAKVVDVSSGEVVPLGDPGELLIRAFSVMLEYWDEPDKTNEAITKDRWYRTGDIASLDRFGYCRIVGRIKDMIIRGGENIYPAEIEQFLHTHPNVQEAQV
uniref:Medium-chain acyl-CoA ligase ACSF2, mitochondrial n=1 Tax=Hucho hucho TaxID=62062 RepID=A0A4W5RNP6_9TELE